MIRGFYVKNAAVKLTSVPFNGGQGVFASTAINIAHVINAPKYSEFTIVIFPKSVDYLLAQYQI
jgi:hypothetical protein